LSEEVIVVPLLDVRQVGECLSLHPDVVRKAIRDGRIKAVDIGTGTPGRPTLRVERAELERFIESRRVSS
jgi:hypothetical protein